MTLVSDIRAMYVDFGESLTIGGTAVTCLFRSGYLDADGVAGTDPAVRCVTSDVASAVVGTTTVVRGSTTYLVRGKQTIAPDELETEMLLERV